MNNQVGLLNIMYLSVFSYGDAALHLLSCFRFTVRYIDDLTSGPNPWLARLLHQSQFVMGTIICGIYPDNLTLKYTGTDPANPDLFHTLDIITIVSSAADVSNAHGGVDQIVKSVTTLYDKRRQACYAGIPIVQYAHVSSKSPAPCLCIIAATTYLRPTASL
jgi:hypothetical protein